MYPWQLYIYGGALSNVNNILTDGFKYLVFNNRNEVSFPCSHHNISSRILLYKLILYIQAIYSQACYAITGDEYV